MQKVQKKEIEEFAEKLKGMTDDAAKKYLDDLAEAVFKTRRLVRKALQADIDELAQVRNLFKAGKRKNVAFTKGEIGGEKIDLRSRSGGELGKKFDDFHAVALDEYLHLAQVCPGADFWRRCERQALCAGHLC